MIFFSCCRGREGSVVAPTGSQRDLLIPVDEETKNVESSSKLVCGIGILFQICFQSHSPCPYILHCLPTPTLLLPRAAKSSPPEENLDDTVDEMLDVPDLDNLENKNGAANASSSTEGIYAFAEEERGVAVMIFNFLMVFLGLSQVSKNSKRKAITNGASK